METTEHNALDLKGRTARTSTHWIVEHGVSVRSYAQRSGEVGGPIPAAFSRMDRGFAHLCGRPSGWAPIAHSPMTSFACAMSHSPTGFASGGVMDRPQWNRLPATGAEIPGVGKVPTSSGTPACRAPAARAAHQDRDMRPDSRADWHPVLLPMPHRRQFPLASPSSRLYPWSGSLLMRLDVPSPPVRTKLLCRLSALVFVRLA
jgi:hypothetical protein